MIFTNMHQILEINKPKTLNADADVWDTRVNSPTGQSHREAGEGFDQQWLIVGEVSAKTKGTSVRLSQATSIHLGG
jgi:hypothetical protein